MVKKFFNLIVAIIIILVILAIWLFVTWLAPVGDKKVYSLDVSKGDTVEQIAEKLSDSGLQMNPVLLSILAKNRNLDNKIKIGRFELNGPISMWQILDQITKSQATEQRITLIEGWSAKQIGDYLEKQGLISSQDFLTYVNNPPQKLFAEFPFLKAGKSLEGFLFPDTYQVYKNVSVEDLVYVLLNNFEKKVGPVTNNNWTAEFYDALILASIVQDEVGANKDMAQVADIFIKRLQIGMPLQSDATVNYITNKGMASPLISDTKIDNPYNTYKYPGLTPGPISNPGVLAISSVLNPIDNPYYYFLTTKTGEVIYSVTFAEHVENKNKYLK